MPRTARFVPGGLVYHVLNRANDRSRIFSSTSDFASFEDLIAESLERVTIQVFAYCLMPNHWHLVLRPQTDRDLPTFMHHLTTTHSRRWRLHRGTVGCGHLYQGPYKSFPVQEDEHLLTLLRYVERNALRAGLVERAEQWRWSSLWAYEKKLAHLLSPPLCSWPFPRPTDWSARVNCDDGDSDLSVVRTSVRRGCPFGEESWQGDTATRLGLTSTLRLRGQPRKWG